MAVIYSYPQKGSVVDGDLFVITDPADSNKTKTVTAQTLANYIDGEITLQEVLDTGNTANNQSITLTGAPGDITISGDFTGDRAVLTTKADIANIEYSSSSILSSAALTIANTTGILNLNSPNNVALTSANASIVLTSGGLAGDDIDLNAGVGEVDIDCAVFDVNSKSTIIDATIGTTSIIGDGAISIGNTNTAQVNMRSVAGIDITAPTPATADVSSTIVFKGPNGVVGGPTYSFSADVDSGMYLEAIGKLAIAAGGANALQLWTANAVKSNLPFQLSNSAGPGLNSYEQLTRFENGTFTPYWTDGNAPLVGAVYANQEGSYIIWQNTLYGYFRIQSSAVPTPPVTGLGINGTIVTGTGAGATLDATFPKVTNTGSSVTIGAISGAAAGTGAPIGGFVSVGTPGQLMVLQTYTSGTDYNRVASLPAMGPTYTIEGTFAYVFET